MPHRGGRPRVHVVRKLEDYPPPTPQPTPCRLWQGSCDGDGYGVLTGNNRSNARQRAHRWVWEATHGPIPPGLVVRHKCDNRPCYRLSHLELGTVADNNDDARYRGHLGPTMKLRPSQIKLLFDLIDQGQSKLQIHRENFADVIGYGAVKRIAAMGREGFDEDYNRIIRPDPINKYKSWRGDEHIQTEPYYGRQVPD